MAQHRPLPLWNHNVQHERLNYLRDMTLAPVQRQPSATGQVDISRAFSPYRLQLLPDLSRHPHLILIQSCSILFVSAVRELPPTKEGANFLEYLQRFTIHLCYSHLYP